MTVYGLIELIVVLVLLYLLFRIVIAFVDRR